MFRFRIWLQSLSSFWEIAQNLIDLTQKDIKKISISNGHICWAKVKQEEHWKTCSVILNRMVRKTSLKRWPLSKGLKEVRVSFTPTPLGIPTPFILTCQKDQSRMLTREKLLPTARNRCMHSSWAHKELCYSLIQSVLTFLFSYTQVLIHLWV